MFYNANFSQKAVTVKLFEDQSVIRFNGKKAEHIIDKDMFHVIYAVIFMALKEELGENLKGVYTKDGEAKFVYEKGLQNPIDLSGLTKASHSCCYDCTVQSIYKKMTGKDFTPEVDRKHEFVSQVLKDLGKFMNI